MRDLIVGTGRCGTGWVAAQLCSLGKRWAHEQVFGLVNRFAEEQANPQWDGESSWLAVPYLQQAYDLGLSRVYHLVRDPLAVLASFHSLAPPYDRMLEELATDGYTQFVYQHRPQIQHTYPTRLDRLAHYYCEWTDWIFEQLEHREVFRLEDEAGQLFEKIIEQRVPFNPSTNLRLLDIEQVLDRKLRYRIMSLRQEWGYPELI